MSRRIKLKPTNNRFKRLIHDFGNEWEVINDPVSMPCFGGAIGITCRPINYASKLSNFEVDDVEFVR